LPVTGAEQQVPPQESVLQAAWQIPPEQDRPGAQALPQEPQLAGSIWVSTHVPLQEVKPAAQACWQLPDAQTCPAEHLVAQEPQCLGSLARLVHTVVAPSAQTTFGELHTQADWVQTSPAGQTTLHPPQWEALELVSTQVPVAEAGGQSATVEGVVLQTHAPAAQVPRPQERPHVPQFAGSVCWSTQASPQEA
jgi:hypothetical protein